MSNKRKQYSPQFKAQVALATLRGDQTLAELAEQYGLHPTVLVKVGLLEAAPVVS
ncbi:transposase [Microcoleus anatoxicus]|uniref:transposase n=1 Tax=Microcoleus anatoxicus TaxID=2705319 RepID=UPI00366DB235